MTIPDRIHNGETVCVSMREYEQGHWHDVPCNDRLKYICEMDREGETRPTDVPTPPANGICAPGWQSFGDNDCIQVKWTIQYIKQDPCKIYLLFWCSSVQQECEQGYQ